MADDRFDEKRLKRAEFCKPKCTACKKSREKDSGFWHTMVKIEEKLCRSSEYGILCHFF